MINPGSSHSCRDLFICHSAANGGKNEVENNYLSVSEKTELELAKLKLNSKNPAEREKAQQTINDLPEKDIASDQKVIEACGNGNAGSAACAGVRWTENQRDVGGNVG